MDVKLYQINMDRDIDLIAFMSLDMLPKFQKSPDVNSQIYDKVFDGTLECSSLEGLYEIFNLHHPDGYKGRSMSVSDVVEIRNSEDPKPGFYFCDSFGFKEISFQPERAKDVINNTIRVVLLEPGKLAKIADIDASLEGMQKVVGGYIEAVYPFEDAESCIVCNEEGKINGLDLNRAIYDGREIVDILAGTAFICDCSGENFGSLSDEKLSLYAKQFKKPEQFMKLGEKIIAIPYTPRKAEHER